MGLEVKHGSGVRLNHVYTPLATSVSSGKIFQRSRGPGAELLEGGTPIPPIATGLARSGSPSTSPAIRAGANPRFALGYVACVQGRHAHHGRSHSERIPGDLPDSLRARLPVLVRLRDFWQHLPRLACVPWDWAA